jgi:hypothetical protein
MIETLYDPSNRLLGHASTMYPYLENVTINQYNDCVKYFLDGEVGTAISDLSPTEKDRFFQMIHDYSALLNKLFLVKGAPFTNYVLHGNEFYDALKNPHEGIDWTPSWIVSEYKEWLVRNNLPFPEDQAVAENLDLSPMLNFQANLGNTTVTTTTV